MQARRPIPIALSVAGSDPSGGAGLLADVKTFHQHGVYGAAVVTLITVQTTRSVSRVETLPADLVVEQLTNVLDDLEPRAIKTGALGSAATVRAVADVLAQARARERPAALVVDPVMVSKHGQPLLDEPAVDVCASALFPLAALITPNLPEAERLLGDSIGPSESDIIDAARALARRFGTNVLLKGGHRGGARSLDVLATSEAARTLDAPRVETRHTHGTGCTLSAAIAARLARGESLELAVERAKRWLGRSLESPPAVGKGIGPVDHFVDVVD